MTTRKVKDSASSSDIATPKLSGPFYSKTFLDMALLSIALRLLQAGISYVLAFLVPFPESLKIPSDSQFFHHINNQQKKPSKKKSAKIEDLDSTNTQLFPSISETTIEASKPAVEVDTNISYAQPCSTGLTTKLLPFKNANGEIEWAFAEDGVSSSELDVFKQNHAPVHINNQNHEALHHNHLYNDYDDELGYDEDDINLSPTVSNSSNNESILSSNNVKTSKAIVKKEDGATPLTSHSSPFTPNEQHLQNHQHHHNHNEESIASYSSSEDIAGMDGEADGKIHQCPHCDANFKIRGYLTRHLKKHATKKAYSCPFHEFSVFIDENNVTHKCHPNGGFSRRDTYKTHLKSRHFKYPKGTKTKERAKSAGSCSMCGETFPNAEIWCELHVEGAECKFLPSGFKGKSRIKNRMKKQLSKQQQKELEKNGGIYSKHFSLAAAVNASKLSGSQTSTQTESFTPSMETPVPATNSTPIPASQNTYGYHHASNSPAVSISSSINNNQVQASPMSQPSKSPSRFSYTPEVSQAQTQMAPPTQPVEQIPEFYPIPQQFEYSQYELGMIPNMDFEDYDDDQFCLDIDQLNNATFNNFNEIIGFMKAKKQAAANAAAGDSNQRFYDSQEQITTLHQQQQYDEYPNQYHPQEQQVYAQQMKGQQCAPIQQQYQAYGNPNPVMYN